MECNGTCVSLNYCEHNIFLSNMALSCLFLPIFFSNVGTSVKDEGEGPEVLLDTEIPPPYINFINLYL